MAPENEQFRIPDNEELHYLCVILWPQKEVIDVSLLNILKLLCFALQYPSPQLPGHYVQRMLVVVTFTTDKCFVLIVIGWRGILQYMKGGCLNHSHPLGTWYFFQ
jgi:hypothetical protein